MKLTKDGYREYERNNPFMSYNHMEICSADAAACTVKVELAPESMNLNGYVHGGLFCAMADCAAGIAARAGGGAFVTQSAHFNFLRNVRAGTVYATAKIVKRGRLLAIFRVEITDGEGSLLADCTVDMIRTD